MTQAWRRTTHGLMLLAGLGCSVRGIPASNSRRVQLKFFNPAERLSAPLRAATVTLQGAGDSRSMDVDVDIRTPADSAILLIMTDGVSLRELLPLLGEQGVGEVRRSQRSFAPDAALPVVQLSAEGVWKPLERVITKVMLGNTSIPLTARYCVLPPKTTSLLRLQQIVYSVPETRNGRYRLRVNWISFRPASSRSVDCVAALRPTVSSRVTAVADDSEAFARRLEMSWIGLVIITVILIGGGFAIVKS